MQQATRQADLFAPQPDLFDRAPPAEAVPSPERILARIHDFLASARAADRMPWDPQRERVVAHLFHNMANWLPPAQRDSLRAAFAAELERLRGER